jgi:predicted RNase H-like HicB family nuclease
MKTFTLDYWTDAGLVVGRLREVPGVLSQGSSLEQLKKNIADAYRLAHASEAASIPSRKSQSIEVAV